MWIFNRELITSLSITRIKVVGTSVPSSPSSAQLLPSSSSLASLLVAQSFHLFRTINEQSCAAKVEFCFLLISTLVSATRLGPLTQAQLARTSLKLVQSLMVDQNNADGITLIHLPCLPFSLSFIICRLLFIGSEVSCYRKIAASDGRPGMECHLRPPIFEKTIYYLKNLLICGFRTRRKLLIEESLWANTFSYSFVGKLMNILL